MFLPITAGAHSIVSNNNDNIEIVKNNWGEDNSVFFDETDTTNEQKAKGEYTICVREKSTTNAKAWYTVDVQNGTAKKWD